MPRYVKDPGAALVVVDVDDVLLPLNEAVAQKAGIDYDKIVTFHAMDNPLLSEKEKKRLYDAYQTPHIHKDMAPYPGALELGRLLAGDPRLAPLLCSNSLDQDVVEDKQDVLKSLWGEDYGAFKEHFNIISMGAAHKKKFPCCGIWLAMDDSPHNANACGAEHILMPRRPWNQSDWGRRALKAVACKIRFYSDLSEAAGIIRDLADRELRSL